MAKITQRKRAISFFILMSSLSIFARQSWALVPSFSPQAWLAPGDFGFSSPKSSFGLILGHKAYPKLKFMAFKSHAIKHRYDFCRAT
jgi:hypothetical protein